MSSLNAAKAQPPFPFNYFVDAEMLNIVLVKEIYSIPFQKAHAAFDMVRQQMIDIDAFSTVPFHRHAPAGANAVPTGLQLLKQYQHLIVNHPSRQVPSVEQPAVHAQFRRRSRLLDQIFSRIIGSIYARGAGRPPRKYAFDHVLDLMLLEQVLQYKAHLRPRSQLSSTFSVIRQSIIVNYGFRSGHIVPAPASVDEGAPTISQLTVRYQFLIASHVNSSTKEEPDQHCDPDSARKRSHLLDIIVRDIVTQALSGSEVLRKSRRSSLEAPENDMELPAPRPKRRKSYPSVEVPLTEPTLRTRGSPVAKVLPSRSTVAGEVDKAGNGYMVVDKAKESRKRSRAEPEDESVWRRRMEERRIALEEEQQKTNCKLAVLQEQQMKIDQQRIKLQEQTLEMMREEHKVFLQTLSGLAAVFTKAAEKLGHVNPPGDSNSKDQVEKGGMPQSCDQAPVDTAALPGKTVTNGETPMDVEQTSKEPVTNGQPAKGKPAIEDNQAEEVEAPGEGQTTVGNESTVKNEPPMQDGSPKENPKGNKEPDEACRAEVVKEIPAKNAETAEKATSTVIAVVGAGRDVGRDSEVESASAAASSGK